MAPKQYEPAPEIKPTKIEKLNMAFTIAGFVLALCSAILIPWGIWSIRTELDYQRSISDQSYVNKTNYYADLHETQKDVEGVKDHVNRVDNEVSGIQGALRNTVGTRR